MDLSIIVSQQLSRQFRVHFEHMKSNGHENLVKLSAHSPSPTNVFKWVGKLRISVVCTVEINIPLIMTEL